MIFFVLSARKRGVKEGVKEGVKRRVDGMKERDTLTKGKFFSVDQIAISSVSVKQ